MEGFQAIDYGLLGEVGGDYGIGMEGYYGLDVDRHDIADSLGGYTFGGRGAIGGAANDVGIGTYLHGHVGGGGHERDDPLCEGGWNEGEKEECEEECTHCNDGEKRPSPSVVEGAGGR